MRMDFLLDALMVICGPDQVARGAWLLPALLLAGLAGSAVHCTAMCGPFVLGQVADGLARMPAARMCQAARLRGSLLLPYHAGRLATYTGMGVAAGWLGALRLPQVVPGLLLALAASVFMVLALQRLQPALAQGRGPRATKFAFTGMAGWGSGIGGIAARLSSAGRPGGVAIGLALGLLPCGMVYAALAAAAAGGPVAGGAGMLAFGLGTVPALVVVGLLGHAFAHRWQQAANRAAPYVLAGNALLLMALAWRAFTG